VTKVISAHVGRTLLSVAFDLDFGFGFDVEVAIAFDRDLGAGLHV
jgi:hypothetical protein